ncbi:MAG: helix-turn-helix transcriptional regulator, partial [Clostridia bacterium]|nr:helix-turn-helix transcriptional regulator [Clostridia bacterium]
MDHYVTGAAIKALREKQRMTQADLAARLCVSDKAVSKWETGRGFPDISLLEPLAEALRVSVPELLSGKAITNTNRAS